MLKPKASQFGRFVRALIAGLLAFAVVDYVPGGPRGVGHYVYLGLAVIAFSTLIHAGELSLRKRDAGWKKKIQDDGPIPNRQGAAVSADGAARFVLTDWEGAE